MKATKIFGDLLQSRSSEIADLARALADAVQQTHPELTSKLSPGWGALNFHHAKAGYVCGVFVRADRVMLLFEHGVELSDPDGVLEGETRQTRHMTFRPGDPVPVDRIGLYVMEAIALRA